MVNLNTKQRRLRAKIMRAVDVIMADCSALAHGLPCELRLIFTQSGDIESSVINRYPAVRDADVTVNDD